MDDINIIFAYKNTSYNGPNTMWHRLGYGGHSCTECSCQDGLLRECPICGMPADREGIMYDHSYACIDFAGTQHPSGRHYVSRILINQKELIRLAIDRVIRKTIRYE